mmetsp:Transcript_8541/g.14825  ORF Transcript_8541/g.14825 Transcript_8541/m.14825 type:complete len:517 (-) Transcript_8541:225-1775(-)|eukprot:CAMPEP_0183729000 /NCGR_PEP_ID=MMETSP0737-20130205/29453_1 /TAXON_ID=385413 /ORGANISM="Thalassiosira miniscula, Strain CCMP1093" /LENGTH=516 /DNA_ID=CAMNT_0025961085 /DNA_START=210 /DNA_END=1760 /DNA_ORIENTATION=-
MNVTATVDRISLFATQYIWSASTDCQIGLAFALNCVILSFLGDEWLYKFSPKKAASAETAPTALLRPLSNLLLAMWLGYYVIKQMILGFGATAMGNFVAAYFFALAVFCWVFFGYWWYPPFRGQIINVREPHVGFGKMSYSLGTDKDYSIFWQMSWTHLSAFLVPFELCIHIMMGKDIDRTKDGSFESCEGMMAQEMNHGKAQLLYSRNAEKNFGYPPGYRKLYKAILFSLPNAVSLSVVACLESIFIPVTGIFSLQPWLFETMWGESKWLWSWHLCEESEHSWDSVPDALSRSNALILWIVYPIFAAFVFLVIGPLSVIEGFLYHWRDLIKNPVALFFSTCKLMLAILFASLFVVSVFLQVLLRQRPSDESIINAAKGMREIYATNCKDAMKTTHVQLPHKKLKNRDSASLRSLYPKTNSRGSIRNSMYFNMASLPSADANEEKGLTDANHEEKARRLSMYRTSLYAKTEEELKSTGILSQADLNDAGFSVRSLRHLSVGPAEEEDDTNTMGKDD